MKTLFQCLAIMLASAALTVQNCQAQEDFDEQKKNINSIKLNPAYLYAEATCSSIEEASALAQDLLKREIDKYVGSKKKFAKATSYVTTDQNASWSKLSLPRGDCFRVFFYVKKADILPLNENYEITEIKPEPEQSAPQTVERPVARQSKVAQRLLNVTNLDELQSCLKQLKAEGLVTEYNKYAALVQPDAYLLVIYNRDKQIEAVLSEGPNRVNLQSGAPDSEKNYKGRAALGVKERK